MTYGSVYEITNPLATVGKQRFIDYFNGKVINSEHWATFDAIGTATESMADTVDGGLEIQHSSTSNSWNGIYFNHKRQYEETGSVIIGVVKRTFGSDSGGGHFGLMGDVGTGQIQSADFTSDTAQVTNFGLRTEDASTGGGTNGSTVIDDIWHSTKIILTASSCVMYLDGVCDVTRATNLPTIPLQPVVYGISRTSSSNDVTSIRYCEAYNT